MRHAAVSFSLFVLCATAAGCGGCYDAFAVDIEVDADEPITECLEARRGPPTNSCGPTGGIIVDNLCEAPLVFANPEIPMIAAGAVGVIVTFDDADYHEGDFEVTGTLDGDPVTIMWGVE